jgi:hypothetical protein
MFDFIPFAGRRRIMCHRDRELFLIGKILQFLLPETISDPVGTAPIGGDEQFALAGIERFARLVPPSPDTLHRTFSRVMIDAHVDEATGVDQIIDARLGSPCLCASERKSYTFTLVSSPLACHSRPLFLKVPSSSFFLQSTEMIGLPSCSNCSHRSLICANWASRSSCEFPSMVFLFARSE